MGAVNNNNLIKSDQFGDSYATKFGSLRGEKTYRLYLEGNRANKTKISAVADVIVFHLIIDYIREFFGMKRAWVAINVVDTCGNVSPALLNIKSLCKRTVLKRHEILDKTPDQLSQLLANPTAIARPYKKMSDLYPNTFLINLDHRKDRIDDVHNHLASIGQHGFSYTRLSAVLGRELPQATIDKMSKSYAAESHGKDDRAGRMGCFLSHLNAIKKAKADNLPNVLILEDDVRFMPEKMHGDYAEKVMKELPQDWGMLYLGHYDYDKEHAKDYSKHLVKPSQPYDLHAYMVNASMYDRLIEVLEKELEKENGQMRAVDVVIAEEITKTGQVFAAKDHVAIQDEGLSSITGHYVSGNYYHEASSLRKGMPSHLAEGTTNDGMPVMEPLMAGTLYQMMYHADQVFTKHGIRYWADGGTQLGATRHEALIPHDDDLDVSVAPGAEKILESESFKADLRERGLQIEPHWLGFKIFAMQDHPLGKTYENFQGCNFKVPALDVFTTYETKDPATGETVYKYATQKAYDIWHHIIHKPSELFDAEGNSHKIPFGPMKISGIKSAQDYCVRNYGKYALNEIYLQYDHIQEKDLERRPIQLTDFRGPAYKQWDGLPQVDFT